MRLIVSFLVSLTLLFNMSFAAINGNNVFPSIPDEAIAVIVFLGVDTYLRPSIALKGNVIVSGSGSASDPFVVR